MVKGINVTIDDATAAEHKSCDPCHKGKLTRPPFGDSDTQVSGVLDLVHMDACGPIDETPAGNRYMVTFVDDYSSLSIVELVPRKSDVPATVRKIFNLLETQTGRKIKIARTDNGREYLTKEIESFFEEKGIRHQLTMPYTPQQNGVAERLNRTLLDKARPMLSEAGLPLRYWGEAIITANTLRNYSPVTGKDKTPWELFYGNKPDLSHLRTFGCRAYVMTPKQQRGHKLEEVGKPGIMIGYAHESKGYRILMDRDNIVKCSRDVTFDETLFPAKEDSSSSSESEVEEEDESELEEIIPPPTSPPGSPSPSPAPSPEPSETPESPAPPQPAGRSIRSTRGILPSHLSGYSLFSNGYVPTAKNQ